MKKIFLFVLILSMFSCNKAFFVNKKKVLHRETGYLLAIYNYRFFSPDKDTSSINMFDKIKDKQAYMVQGYCNGCTNLIKLLPHFKIYMEVKNVKDTTLLFPQVVNLAPVIIYYTIDNYEYGKSNPTSSSIFLHNGKEYSYKEGRSLNYIIWNIDCDLIPKAID